jgi:hypothetical protein
MSTKLFVGSATVVVLVVASVAFAGAFTKPEPTITQQGYICPMTGEELPSPLCCPYKGHAEQAEAKAQFDCCLDPDCPPGCCPECPPDCKPGCTSKCPPCDRCP